MFSFLLLFLLIALCWGGFIYICLLAYDQHRAIERRLNFEARSQAHNKNLTRYFEES